MLCNTNVWRPYFTVRNLVSTINSQNTLKVAAVFDQKAIFMRDSWECCFDQYIAVATGLSWMPASTHISVVI
jgi:hypothetical protein